MWGVEKEKLVKLIMLVNWLNFGVGIMCNVLFVLATFGYWTGYYDFIYRLWDFLGLRRESFRMDNYTSLIVFVTGLIFSQRRLNILLANCVKKPDELNFLKWFKITAVSTAVEWIVIGFMCNWYVYGLMHFIYPFFWIYVSLRVIYPVISSSIIFHVYFYVKLCYRSDDSKILPADV